MSKSIQLACFKLGDEKYAADIMMVKEIILYRKGTKIPSAPVYIEGIINLRGTVMPVIDMRKRIGMPAIEPSRSTRIIIVKLHGKDIGMIVDSVSKVLRIGEGEIQPPPNIAKGAESVYLRGVLRDGDELIMVLDLERIISSTESIRLKDVISSTLAEGA